MLKKIILGLIATFVAFVVGVIVFVQISWDKVYDIDYPALETSTDSAVIAHGKYLVHGPAHCTGCHVSGYEDMLRVGRGEEVPLMGGVSLPLGPLGVIHPNNLTPDLETGIGRYSDQELFRMMRHAVKPNGRSTLTPMMPFWNMADDDMVAVVSYLKSMPPVRNKVPESEWTFTGKAVRSFAPTFRPVMNPNPPAKAPAMAVTVERGEYLARSVANCVGCHTPRDPMTFDAIGYEFSGGMEFEPLPELHEALSVATDLWTRSVNLTPAPGSALAKFPTADSWVARFRQGKIIPHSPMDWAAFGKMTDTDLKALYTFFQSLDPVTHDIEDVVFTK